MKLDIVIICQSSIKTRQRKSNMTMTDRFLERLYDEDRLVRPVADPGSLGFGSVMGAGQGQGNSGLGSFHDVVQEAGSRVSSFVKGRYGWDLNYRMLDGVRESDLSGTAIPGGGRALGLYEPSGRRAFVEERLPRSMQRYVAAHELAHYFQHVSGRLGRYLRHGERKGRYLAEREANYIARGALRRGFGKRY
jgi:hypothetical protein